MSSPRRSDSDSASPPAIDTGDLISAACSVCRLGYRRSASPAAPRVRVPPPGSRVSSVRDLVQDANTLLDANRALRHQVEVLGAYNAGLAMHAETLHDRNLAILRRGREGFELGAQTVNNLHVRMEAIQRENSRLVEVAASLKSRVSKADYWEHSHRVLEKSSYEDYCALQDTLTAAQSHAADLESRLATHNAQISSLESQLVQERALVAQLQACSASSAAAPPSTLPAPGSARDGPNRVSIATSVASVGSQASLLLPSQLADAIQTRDTALAAAVDQAQQHAAMEKELRAARDALAQSRSEVESARRLNAPLQDDLRRVNALLTAHAEERKRDLDRTRALEEAVSTAEAARVVAQADRARAEVSETQAVARSDQYRRGWLDIRRAADQERSASAARIHRLSTRVVDLEGELDRSQRDLNDRATAWRRLLRDARRGRETARRVCHALSARLAASVDAAGGRVDVGALVRDLELNMEAVVASEVPLPPEDPDQAREDTEATSPVLTTPQSSPSVGRPLHAPSGRSPKSQPGTPSGAPSVGDPSQPGAPSPRRSSRLSTAADTAASNSAASQRRRSVSARRDASSVSDEPGRSPPAKRRRIRRRVSRSRSSSHGRPASPAASVRSGSPARSSQSEGPTRSASPARSTRSGPASSRGSGTEDDTGSSSSSSSGSSPSSAADSDSDDDPAAPFFSPVIPPAGDRHVWRRRLTAPWPRFLRHLRLAVISPRQIRSRCLPPPAWIYPTVPTPEPATWNIALVTPANVDALYATRPWRYLTQLVESFTFAAGDASFQRFLVRYRVHLEHWAQAYWESTHELVVSGPEWDAWRRRRNSRRSHAGDHFTSVVQLVVELFQERLADLDLFLDPVILHFSPSRSGAGRWYPGTQYATLQEALDAIDAQEPWRRFFRSPLTVAEMNAGATCTVTRAHPAFSVPRLENKFIQEI